MHTTAAVLEKLGNPLVLAELAVPALRPGQVLVAVAFAGVCHTQLLECRGRRGDDPYLPHCLGHEGSGTVRVVGQGVSKCRVGDHVVLSWIKGSGADVPGTVYSWNGRDVNAGGVTTFARHTVVSENRVTVIPPSLDLRAAAFLGCAVATGIGAVRNTAELKRGQSLAVFGVGGVGLCAVAGGRIAGAEPIVAVDVCAERLQLAVQFGATHSIQAGRQDPIAEIQRLCPGGVDVAVEASGQPAVMLQALAPCVGKAVLPSLRAMRRTEKRCRSIRASSTRANAYWEPGVATASPIATSPSTAGSWKRAGWISVRYSRRRFRWRPSTKP